MSNNLYEIFFHTFGVLFIFMVFKARVYVYMLFLFFIYILMVSLVLYFLGWEILTFMLILVYAGAVVILFLYVTMLFQGQVVTYSKNSFYITVAIYILFLTLLKYSQVQYGVAFDNYSMSAGEPYGDFFTNLPQHEDLYTAVSIYLFSQCIFEFFVVGCMLFICFLGVVRLLKVSA